MSYGSTSEVLRKILVAGAAVAALSVVANKRKSTSDPIADDPDPLVIAQLIQHGRAEVKR